MNPSPLVLTSPAIYPTKLVMMEEFLRNKLRTLKPTSHVFSPIKALSELKSRQWLYLLLANLAWCWDAFDYYSISAVSSELQVYFGKSSHAIMLGLTISLIPRFSGAAMFGLMADRYGRRWPFIINCALLVILELSLAFCKTYGQFIVCRVLFGWAMGGIYGNATTTALEDCPKNARALAAGLFQSGYPLGFLLATAFWAAFNPHWKHLFYFAACPPLLLIVFRYLLPETDFFEYEVRARNNSGDSFEFLATIREAMRRHWRRILYLIAFMFGCTMLTHGSEDVFPLLLTTRDHPRKYAYTSKEVTTTQVTAYVGGTVGSWILAYISQVTGRRFSIIISCLIAVILVYPYCFVSGPGLYPIVFIVQFLIQGIFGIVPMHLIELSPPAFRTFVVGTAYNLGVLCAAWVPMVETLLGEGTEERKSRYSQVMGVILGLTFVYLMVVVVSGPEERRRRMSGVEEDGMGEVEGQSEMEEDRVDVRYGVQRGIV